MNNLPSFMLLIRKNIYESICYKMIRNIEKLRSQYKFLKAKVVKKANKLQFMTTSSARVIFIPQFYKL